MKKQPAKPEVSFPDFKSEQEEANWWDANADFMFERLKKYGKLAGPLKVAKPEPATRSISLRVAVDDIERAKAIASEKSMGYQTVLKQAIREGLKKTG